MSFLLVLALLSADPPTQPMQAPAGAPAAIAPAAAKPAKPKLICKVSSEDTGSRMVKKTCLTQQEWDARVQGRSADDMETLPTSH